MSDERLLSEALRAHAAGGVSTPGGAAGGTGDPSPPTEAHEAPSGGSRLRDRFRPLGRRRGQEEAAPGNAPETVAQHGPATAGPPGMTGPGPAVGKAPAGPTAVGPTAAGPTPAGPVPGGPGAGGPTTTGPYSAATRGGPPMPRPAPRPGPATAERPWAPGAPPPRAPARPGPPPPGPGPAGRPAAPGVPRARPVPAPGTAPPPADAPSAWTPARIAWWSGVALLAGAVAGALAAVGTLALPG